MARLIVGDHLTRSNALAFATAAPFNAGNRTLSKKRSIEETPCAAGLC
jgi:hypothetical protein